MNGHVSNAGVVCCGVVGREIMEVLVVLVLVAMGWDSTG